MTGTWIKSGYVASEKAVCLKVDCAPGQTSVVRVHITSTYFVECKKSGASITMDTTKGYTGAITCPDI